jgi:hypothetical protein
LIEEDLSQYTIYDVLMPLPGTDVAYPGGELGALYREFLTMDGLDPSDFSRKQRCEIWKALRRHADSFEGNILSQGPTVKSSTCPEKCRGRLCDTPIRTFRWHNQTRIRFSGWTLHIFTRRAVSWLCRFDYN